MKHVRVSFQTYTGFVSNPYGFRIEPGKARACARAPARTLARVCARIRAFNRNADCAAETPRTQNRTESSVCAGGEWLRIRRDVSHEVTKPRRRRGVFAPQILPFAYFLTCVRDILTLLGDIFADALRARHFFGGFCAGGLNFQTSKLLNFLKMGGLYFLLDFSGEIIDTYISICRMNPKKEMLLWQRRKLPQRHPLSRRSPL